MKKLVAILVLIILAGLALFIANSDGQGQVNNSNAPSTTGNTGQEALIETHLSRAVQKQTVDASESQQVNVSIGDFFFDPTVLTIKSGTTVTWTNNGHIRHDVTSDKDSPNQGLSSELLGQGESYSFTFEATGLYLYICSPHPTQMRAAIKVVD